MGIQHNQYLFIRFKVALVLISLMFGYGWEAPENNTALKNSEPTELSHLARFGAPNEPIVNVLPSCQVSWLSIRMADLFDEIGFLDAADQMLDDTFRIWQQPWGVLHPDIC